MAWGTAAMAANAVARRVRPGCRVLIRPVRAQERICRQGEVPVRRGRGRTETRMDSR